MSRATPATKPISRVPLISAHVVNTSRLAECALALLPWFELGAIVIAPPYQGGEYDGAQLDECIKSVDKFFEAATQFEGGKP